MEALRPLNRVSAAALNILKSMTLPGEYSWPRVASVYGSDLTATAKLYRKANVRNGTSGFIGDISNSATTAFAFRDALRAGLYSFGLAGLDNCVYQVQFNVHVPLSNTEYYPEYLGPAVLDDVASNVSPHGGYLYAGRLGPTDPSRGWLVSIGGVMNLSSDPIYGLPPGTKIGVILRRFVSNAWQDYAESSYNATDGLIQNFTADRTAYYAISYVVTLPGLTSGPSAISGGTLRIQQSGAASRVIWAQQALPNIEDVLSQVKSYSVPAVSLMYTNTASPLNRQGQIAGLQLPRETNPLAYIDMDILTSEAKVQIQDVVNGMYGFLKPSSPSDFDMKVFEYEAAFASIDTDFVFELIPKSDYLVVHAEVTDPNGRQGYWTFDWLQSYISLSQYADQRPPTCTWKDFDEALQMLSRIPQWHTNSLHLSDIWEGIKDVAGKVWSGVKDIASVAAPLIPIAAALL